MALIFSNQFIELVLHKEDKLLVQKWSSRYSVLDEFKEAINITLSLLEAHNVKKVLVDTSIQPVIGTNRADYVASVIPTVKACGIKKVAFVLSNNIFKRQGIKRFTSEPDLIYIRNFNNEKEAMAWLIE